MAKNANPNILGHRDVMKADYYEKFLVFMKEEMESLYKNRIYSIVPISSVPKEKPSLG